MRVIHVEGLGHIKWQHKPKQIQAPKREIRHRKRSPHHQPPPAPAVLRLHLQHLIPHPLHNRQHPHRVEENRHQHPNRQREPTR